MVLLGTEYYCYDVYVRVSRKPINEEYLINKTTFYI